MVGAAVQAPPVCCCCLSPSARVLRLRIGPVGYNQYLIVPIPFCAGCRARRLLYGLAQWTVLLTVVAGVTYGVSRLPLGGIGRCVRGWGCSRSR